MSRIFYKIIPSFSIFFRKGFFFNHLLIISDKYQLGLLLFIFLLNFQLSVTNFILSGLPSIIFSSFFLTEITSATNFTVANKLSLIFSYFSTEDSLTPIKVNSDFIFSLFLTLWLLKNLRTLWGLEEPLVLLSHRWQKMLKCFRNISAPLKIPFLFSL